MDSPQNNNYLAYQVVIIGSGFGGMVAALNLRKIGINDFVILERRDFMGGTWSQNTYPGAAVDVQSPLYSIAGEPYDWSQMFAGQHELQEYTEHVIDKHGLREITHTNSNVSKIEWHQDAQQWLVHVKGKATYAAQFVINATGPLSTPVIPKFKGKEIFEGRSFHTNNWDHSFDYKRKRVAIIGSGASAAQVIPTIAPDVAELHVFQRTPHWVIPRADYVFKNWQRKLLRKRWVYKALRILIYWALEIRVVGFKYSRFLLDLLASNEAKAFLKKAIPDPSLRAKLTPDYTIGCKRVILSNSLYPALCRDNVTVHDRIDGIQEITKSGIVSQSGEEHPLDLIIYSTGYDATDGLVSYPVIGKGGKTLGDFWHDYPRAYLGTMVPDFPNLFVVTGPNTGIGHTSAIFVIESQMQYIMDCIQKVKKAGQRSIAIKPEAEQRYTDHIHQEMEKNRLAHWRM